MQWPKFYLTVVKVMEMEESEKVRASPPRKERHLIRIREEAFSMASFLKADTLVDAADSHNRL